MLRPTAHQALEHQHDADLLALLDRRLDGWEEHLAVVVGVQFPVGLEPDHHAGGADEGDHEHAGGTVRINLAGEQFKAQVDLSTGGLGGSEQDWIVDLVPHEFHCNGAPVEWPDGC
jgi:hypothetical protein